MRRVWSPGTAAPGLNGQGPLGAMRRAIAAPGRSSGTTMIEVLIATVVVAILIVPIYNAIVSGKSFTSRRGDKRMALRLVERKAEQLMGAGYGSSGTDDDVSSVNVDTGVHPTDPSIVVSTRGDADATNDVLGDLTWTVTHFAYSTSGDSIYRKTVDVQLRWPQGAPRDSVGVTVILTSNN